MCGQYSSTGQLQRRCQYLLRARKSLGANPKAGMLVLSKHLKDALPDGCTAAWNRGIKARPRPPSPAPPQMHLCRHLQSEAKGCDHLVLWLDCDREGENICFEVGGHGEWASSKWGDAGSGESAWALGAPGRLGEGAACA